MCLPSRRCPRIPRVSSVLVPLIYYHLTIGSMLFVCIIIACMLCKKCEQYMRFFTGFFTFPPIQISPKTMQMTRSKVVRLVVIVQSFFKLFQWLLVNLATFTMPVQNQVKTVHSSTSAITKRLPHCFSLHPPTMMSLSEERLTTKHLSLQIVIGPISTHCPSSSW